ncbi:MAG: hypothetical protein H5T61_01585 [Thermoflexales bacterium]|nr:hypothetical protein [Thermoflexales bacterium]
MANQSERTLGRLQRVRRRRRKRNAFASEVLAAKLELVQAQKSRSGR